MAQTIVVKLTDDIDGGEAEETVSFAVDGRSYEIDLNAHNAQRLRSTLEPYIERARPAGRPTAHPPAATRTKRAATRRGPGTTLFSQLDSEEKDRFRAWADLPSARRIADTRVQAWIDAGRP